MAPFECPDVLYCSADEIIVQAFSMRRNISESKVLGWTKIVTVENQGWESGSVPSAGGSGASEASKEPKITSAAPPQPARLIVSLGTIQVQASLRYLSGSWSPMG